MVIEPRTTDQVMAPRRNVLEQAPKELGGAQAHQLTAERPRPESDFAFEGAKQTLVFDRTTPQIASQVRRNALSMRVLLLDVDDPIVSAGPLQDPQSIALRRAGWQSHLIGLDRSLQPGLELPFEHPTRHLLRQEDRLLRLTPATLLVDSTLGHQSVNVGMEQKRPGPGVLRQDHSWRCPTPTLILHQLQERLPGRVEHQVRQQATVVAPQR